MTQPTSASLAAGRRPRGRWFPQLERCGMHGAVLSRMTKVPVGIDSHNGHVHSPAAGIVRRQEFFASLLLSAQILIGSGCSTTPAPPPYVPPSIADYPSPSDPRPHHDVLLARCGRCIMLNAALNLGDCYTGAALLEQMEHTYEHWELQEARRVLRHTCGETILAVVGAYGRPAPPLRQPAGRAGSGGRDEAPEVSRDTANPTQPPRTTAPPVVPPPDAPASESATHFPSPPAPPVEPPASPATVTGQTPPSTTAPRIAELPQNDAPAAVSTPSTTPTGAAAATPALPGTRVTAAPSAGNAATPARPSQPTPATTTARTATPAAASVPAPAPQTPVPTDFDIVAAASTIPNHDFRVQATPRSDDAEPVLKLRTNVDLSITLVTGSVRKLVALKAGESRDVQLPSGTYQVGVLLSDKTVLFRVQQSYEQGFDYVHDFIVEPDPVRG